MVIQERTNEPVFIGYIGENESREIPFFIGDIKKKYPAATYTVMHQRPTDSAAYPVSSDYYEISGNALVWTVQSGDLTAEGYGKFQIKAAKNGKIRKTKTWVTQIGEALEATADPPDPWSGWTEDVEEAASDAEAYAIGKRGGEDVGSSDPAYHNNSKYYAEQASTQAAAAAAALIDDSSTALNKVWSAHKTDAEVNDLKSALSAKAEIKESTKTGVDCDVSDESGNVIMRLSGGHIQTKEFDSRNAGTNFVKESSATGIDLDVSDESGNVIMRISDGHIQTKKFNSNKTEIPVVETFTKSGSYTRGTALVLTPSEKFNKGDHVIFHLDDGSKNYEAGHRATYYENSSVVIPTRKGSNGYVEYIVKSDNASLSIRIGGSEYQGDLENITAYIYRINGEIKPKIVTVASNGSGMFTTIREAIDSITDANAYTNPYEIWVYPGTYNTLSGYSDEEISDVTVPYTQTSFVGPKLTDGMSIKGVGGTRDEIILTATLDPDDWGTNVRGQVSTLNLQGSGSMENLTILAYNIRYCVHDDFRNPANQKTFRKLKNIKFGGSLTNTPKFATYGAGMSTPRDYIIEDCDFGYTIGIHGNTNFEQECQIIMNNSSGYAFVIGDYADETTDAVVNYEVNNCNFERIYINRHYPSVTTPHTRLYGTGNEQTMVSCDDIFIWQFGNVVKIEAGFTAGDVIAHSSGLDTFEKTTNIDAFCGVVINADSNYSYVQRSGFVCSKHIGLSSLSIGDYITIDGTTKKAVSGGTSSNAIGVVTAVESDGTAFIRLRK